MLITADRPIERRRRVLALLLEYEATRGSSPHRVVGPLYVREASLGDEGGSHLRRSRVSRLPAPSMARPTGEDTRVREVSSRHPLKRTSLTTSDTTKAVML